MLKKYIQIFSEGNYVIGKRNYIGKTAKQRVVKKYCVVNEHVSAFVTIATAVDVPNKGTC